MKKALVTRSVEDDDRPWVREVLNESWGSSLIVTMGAVHDAADLPGIVALFGQKRVGLLTYRIDARSCELVTLNSLINNAGVGTYLLQMLEKTALCKGCNSIRLCTTNDNTHALRFYLKRGFAITKVNVAAIDAHRKIKPQIPELGDDGIPIRDEIVLEKRMEQESDV